MKYSGERNELGLRARRYFSKPNAEGETRIKQCCKLALAIVLSHQVLVESCLLKDLKVRMKAKLFDRTIVNHYQETVEFFGNHMGIG